MIALDRVSKAYRTKAGIKPILRDVSLRLPRGRSIAVLGSNGAGKSTLLRLIAGCERPDRGRVLRTGRISWPLAASGGFHGSLSGIENTRFVARIYGADIRSTIDFVADFAELGPYFEMPVRTYSSGMRARLAFALSMAIAFDCYLIDEITAVGDVPFQRKCQAAFARIRANADIIMVSHNLKTLNGYCQSALLLADGHVRYFEDLGEATAQYRQKVA